MNRRGRRGARTWAGLAGVVGAIVCIVHASACKNDGTHVYVGRFYLEGRGCLGTSSALDVLSGDEPGTCAAVCIIQRRGDAARSVFVSTMCPPYPSALEFDVSSNDPICAPALAALSRNDTCATDGGSSNPDPPPIDASTD